jgi:hypothetical protein
MTQTKKGAPAAQPTPKSGPNEKAARPGWTRGLRQLYDQVVEEELPDSFQDLLSRLDEDS